MGFKLHLIINNKGEIMAIKITKVNASDLSAVSGITEVCPNSSTTFRCIPYFSRDREVF